eukprot:Lithocolla_globosa_v1_NODE_3214_length_1732_cov_31.298507.p1 type:complete len:109 gc:universal NODE_3214_length_1732_cov_31.298507:1559-1233(-)
MKERHRQSGLTKIPKKKPFLVFRKEEDLTDAKLMTLVYATKCELIRNDPVTCARHFDRMVKVLFSKVLGNNKIHPLGTLQDYFYRIEFQQCGTPHVHCLLWIEQASHN